jgi:hypothetical protein
VIHKKGYSIVGVLLFNITVSSIIVQQTKNKERTLLRCLSEKLVSLFNVYHSIFSIKADVYMSNDNSCLNKEALQHTGSASESSNFLNIVASAIINNN